MKSSPDQATSGASTRRGDPRRVAGLLLVALVTLAGTSLLLEAVTNRTEPVGPPPPQPPTETAPPLVERDLSRADLPPGFPGPGSADFDRLVRQELAKTDDPDSESAETADEDEAPEEPDEEEQEDKKKDDDEKKEEEDEEETEKDRDENKDADEKDDQGEQDADDAAPTAGMTRSVPTAVRIPQLSVDAEVTSLEPDGEGRLAPPSPTDATTAGWYEPGAAPGETGTAVLLGRAATGADDPGVFADVGSLTVDDEIEVDREDGRVARFVVERVGSHPGPDFLAALVSGATDQSGLRLIACDDAPEQDAESDGCHPVAAVFATLAEEGDSG